MFSYKTKTDDCLNMTIVLLYTYECPLRGSRNLSGWDLSNSKYKQISGGMCSGSRDLTRGVP